MKTTCRSNLIVSAFVFTFALFLSACGGGGSGDTVEKTQSPPQSYAFEDVTVTSAGGEYKFDNGIILSIPAGAVTQDTVLSLRRIPANEIESILNSYGQLEKTVLAAVQSSTTGVSFQQPITLSIPLESTLSPSALPLLMVVDTKNGIYAFDPSESTSNTSNVTASLDSQIATSAIVTSSSLGSLGAKFVQYDCENNRVIVANISGLPEGERALVAAAIHELRKESDCFENPCRCCGIRVQEEAQDILEVKAGVDDEQTCYNASIRGTVQYLQCGDGTLTESYELSENSVTAINYTPSELEMEPASGAVVKADIVDAKGDPLEEFNIVRVISDHPDVAENGFIEVDKDRFQVLAKKPGQANLSAEVQCKITSKEPLPVTVKKIPIVSDQEQLVVPEGESTSFQVRLGAPPPKDVSIIFLAVELAAGSDPDITIIQTAADFDENNWNVDQQVTLAAAEDDDAFNGIASLLLYSDSDLLDDRALSVTEIDNDLLQFVTSSGGIPVPEGGNAFFSVRLTGEPLDTVNVSVSHVFGDTDISVGSGALLSFNLFDWDIPQAVVLNAAEDDDDIINGVATIRVSDDAGQISSVDIAATEVDNDALEMTMTPAELCVERGQTANFSVIASTAVDFSQLQWESSDLNVATVDQTGNVTAQGDGPALIVAQVEGAQASAVVRVREHCFRIEPSKNCLHAPVPGLPILPTNLQQLKPRIDTAMAGHTVSYVSSNEAVVTIDATGTLTAHTGGDAVISASVDNVVTNYNYSDVISVHVAGSLDEYRATPINLPIFTTPPDPNVHSDWLAKIDPYALFMTDQRNIITQDHIVLQAEEAGANCGGFPTAPDFYTITDFNNSGEYVGYYDHGNGRSAIYLDSSLCIFREMGIYRRETAKAINNLGMTAIDIIDYDGNDRIAIAARTGSVSAPYAKKALGLNNNGLLLLNSNEPDPVWWDDTCFDAYALIDVTMGADLAAIVDMIISPPSPPLEQSCDHPVPMALNNYDIVVGHYQWGQYEEHLLGTFVYHTHPDGMFLYYRDVYYDVPVGTYALDVNDSQDILGVSPSGAYVAHVCPFTLNTNVCDWIPEDRRQEIQGYEPTEEFTCDGLDNDCDGLVDEALIAPMTFKQEGVCAGMVQECKGAQGWVDDYSSIPDYEFPEVSCDGKDNDCDGDVDEGCPTVATTQ